MPNRERRINKKDALIAFHVAHGIYLKQVFVVWHATFRAVLFQNGNGSIVGQGTRNPVNKIFLSITGIDSRGMSHEKKIGLDNMIP